MLLHIKTEKSNVRFDLDESYRMCIWVSDISDVGVEMDLSTEMRVKLTKSDFDEENFKNIKTFLINILEKETNWICLNDNTVTKTFINMDKIAFMVGDDKVVRIGFKNHNITTSIDLTKNRDIFTKIATYWEAPKYGKITNIKSFNGR